MDDGVQRRQERFCSWSFCLEVALGVGSVGSVDFSVNLEKENMERFRDGAEENFRLSMLLSIYKALS